MDAELGRRWRKGRKPFNGMTIGVEQLMPLAQLRHALGVIVEDLEAGWPDAVLLHLRDWDQHCAPAEPPRGTWTWDQLRLALASDEALYAVRAGDTYVRVGLYPSDFGFYLRFYPEDEGDADDRWGERLGDFDLTCAPDLAKRIVRRLAPLSLAGLLCAPAKGFFDRRYNDGRGTKIPPLPEEARYRVVPRPADDRDVQTLPPTGDHDANQHPIAEEERPAPRSLWAQVQRVFGLPRHPGQRRGGHREDG
jgi:hypothetical protein